MSSSQHQFAPINARLSLQASSLIACLVLFLFAPFASAQQYGSATACAGMQLGTPTNGPNGGNLNGFVPFPSTNAWNVNIANAPIDSNSSALAAVWSAAGGYKLHPNFGSSPGDGGIPYIVVDSTVTPSVPINVLDAADQSDVVIAPYPGSDAVPIEGDPDDCSGWPDTYNGDAHALVLDRAKCWLYETFNTNTCNGLWDASSETIWDMENGESRPWGWTSADAAGLPIFPGLVRYDEASTGAIKHAFRVTITNTAGDDNGGFFVLPATHGASSNKTANLLPEGARLRLKPNTDISSFSTINQTILTAMMNYGLIVADNGGNFFVTGDTDTNWDDDDLGNWHGGSVPITSADFDVIQMTPAYPGMDSVSAYTDYPGTVPVINSFTSTTTSVTAGSPSVTFNFSVTGDSYDYIDNVGPVRLTSGSGSVTITPTTTQAYTLYSTNSFGRATSSAISVSVPGSGAAAPVFNPPAGVYASAQTVTISDSTPGVTIYYTTDRSTPTINSAVYSNTPITVASNEQLQAFAIASGYTPSSVITANYTIGMFPANGLFNIQNQASGLVLDGGASGTKKGTWVVQDAVNGSASQQWNVTSLGGGTFEIISSANGLALDEYGDDTADGSEIDVYTNTASSGNTGQVWYLSPIGGGYYTLASQDVVNANVNSCIEPSGGSTASGAEIVTFACTTTSAQQWSFVPAVPMATTPTFSVAAGNYYTAQNVGISDATSGSTIYYTTDNSTPTTLSTKYTTAVNVSVSETLKAIATASGYATSPVGSISYAIGLPLAAPPSFSPLGGTYISAQTVTISDATSGVSIYYTTDGSTPSVSSAVYTGPITFSGTTTLNAIAAGASYSNSGETSTVYNINTYNCPTGSGSCYDTFAGAAGTALSAYNPNWALLSGSWGPMDTTGANSVTLSTADSWAQYSYSASTSEVSQITVPTSNDTNGVYTRAACVRGGGSGYCVSFGAVSGGNYTTAYVAKNSGYLGSVGVSIPATTTHNLGIVASGTSTVTLSLYVDGVLKGTVTDSSGSPILTLGPGIQMRFPTVLADSTISGWQDFLTLPAAATPTFSPVAGSYPSAQTVAISDSTSNTTIYYTTDGSVPTTGSAQYTVPITVSQSEIVQAIAAGSTNSSSPVGSAAYSIQAATPTFNPTGGYFPSTQSVSISDTSSGAGIYYTTDGSAPTYPTTGTTQQYSSSITISTSTTLKAIAGGTNYTNSSVGSAVFTFGLPPAAQPTLSPASGTYSSIQTVTISDTTTNAVIYYTTDGSAPTISSTLYTAPFAVPVSETINAVAIASGYQVSSPGSAAYTMNLWTNNYINIPTDEFAASALYLNGGAAVTSGGMLQLTDGSGNEARSAWFNTKVPDQIFNTEFTFKIPTSGADGMTFTLQGQGPTALGGTGGYFGYYGITPSIAIWFNYYAGNTTGLYVNGATPSGVTSTNLSSSGINLSSGDLMDVHLFYDNTNLTMKLTDTVSSAMVTLVYPVNIPSIIGGNTAYVGFTGGDGGSTSTQDVVSWMYGSPILPPAPTPVFSIPSGTYAPGQSATISDSVSTAAIYYTTDGSTPTYPITGTTQLYSGSIAVVPETVQAIAVAAGYTNSAVGSAVYIIGVAVPVFSPGTGTYTTVQSVTITDAFPGATLYYTTDGSTPSPGVGTTQLYSGPVTVSAAETINAVGIASGYPQGPVGSAVYTFSIPPSNPVYVQTCNNNDAYGTSASCTLNGVGAGHTLMIAVLAYASQTTVTSSAGTPVPIYANINGPNSLYDSAYILPNTVSGSITLTASQGSGGANVEISVYEFSNVAASPLDGSAETTTGSYAQTTPNFTTTAASDLLWTACFTENGAPTIGTAPITWTQLALLPTSYYHVLVQDGLTGAAGNYYGQCNGFGGYGGTTITAALKGTAPVAGTPTFSPGAGTYTSVQTVTLGTTTPSATFYYTTDGTTPTYPTTGTTQLYTGSITVSTSETLNAIAVATGYTNSAVGSAIYTITLPANVPTFTPLAGSYATAQSVAISDSTPNATIYYTTNGNAPSTSSSLYSTAIAVTSNETIQAIAVAANYQNSGIGSAAYTIAAATPTFSPAAGSYGSAQSVSISDATANSTIYYTTNGSVPTIGSPVYSAAITVSGAETLQAIAVASGYGTSAASTAAYTIPPYTPVLSLAAGSYYGSQTVTITDATPGATIYYTTNATVPTTNSATYTAPLAITAKPDEMATGRDFFDGRLYAFGRLAGGDFALDDHDWHCDDSCDCRPACRDHAACDAVGGDCDADGARCDAGPELSNVVRGGAVPDRGL